MVLELANICLRKKTKVRDLVKIWPKSSLFAVKSTFWARLNERMARGHDGSPDFFSKCFERRSEIASVIAYGPSEDFRTAANLGGFNSLQYPGEMTEVKEGNRTNQPTLPCVDSPECTILRHEQRRRGGQQKACRRHQRTLRDGAWPQINF